MMRPGREQQITQLVQRLIDLLGSDEVAIDNRHTPKLYSRFLTDVLAKHKRAKAARESDMDASREANPRVVGTFNSQPQGMTQGPEVYDPSSSPSSTMDVRSSAFSSPSLLTSHPSTMDYSTAFAPTAAPVPVSDFYSFPSGPPPYEQTSSYTYYGNTSPTMNVDRPLLPPVEPMPQDDMVLSMAALTDPAFWEHGAMPGFSWTTNPGAWPIAVDAALGNRGYENMDMQVSVSVSGSGGVGAPQAGVHSSSSLSSFSARV